jgi:hypothetical protein
VHCVFHNHFDKQGTMHPCCSDETVSHLGMSTQPSLSVFTFHSGRIIRDSQAIHTYFLFHVHIMQAIPRLMDPVDGEKAAHEMARLTNNTSASEDTAAARAGALQV